MQYHPFRAALASLFILGGCAAPPPIPAAQVLVFGEQHDQRDHQRQVAATVEGLARDGRLGALVLEMAEQGRSTAGLPVDADAARVREALGWSGWEWPAYEGVVMAAVRAGVPVLGGNLPRARQREAMGDATQDAVVDADARERIAAAVREGHCGLLPAAQEPGMVRVQIARDRAMAGTVAQAAAAPPGDRRVVLLTGAQHASRDRGVPLHLARLGSFGVHVVIFGDDAPGLAADERRRAALTPQIDHCEALRKQLASPRAASQPS